VRTLIALCFTFISWTYAHAQEPKTETKFYRVRVMQADPWYVKAMLEGVAIDQPELSTIFGFAGIPDQEGGLLAGLLGPKGKVVVDPTDNSLVFIVKR
jgi:hypothetical protein